MDIMKRLYDTLERVFSGTPILFNKLARLEKYGINTEELDDGTILAHSSKLGRVIAQAKSYAELTSRIHEYLDLYEGM